MLMMQLKHFNDFIQKNYASIKLPLNYFVKRFIKIPIIAFIKELNREKSFALFNLLKWKSIHLKVNYLSVKIFSYINLFIVRATLVLCCSFI